MSSHRPTDARGLRDPDLIGAEAAMRRAALRARLRAERVARSDAMPRQDGLAGMRASGPAQAVDRDPGVLTFSQAQSYEELPKPLALEELPREARMRVWNSLHSFIWEEVWLDPDGIPRFDANPWPAILFSVHTDHFVRAVDDWPDDRYYFLKPTDLRSDLEELPFNKAFDLIQFILRHPKCPRSLVGEMKKVFADSQLAYTIDEGPPPTIVPAVTREEGTMIVESLRVLRAGSLEGSVAHLHKASEGINMGDWAGSIRESIHAVEAVARQLDPAARTLGQALKPLRADRTLHPALRAGLEKLYGYTCDEQGVRHALLEEDQSNVSVDEAVFMLGACASFASYLWRKQASGVS